MGCGSSSDLSNLNVNEQDDNSFRDIKKVDGVTVEHLSIAKIDERDIVSMCITSPKEPVHEVEPSAPNEVGGIDNEGSTTNSNLLIEDNNSSVDAIYPDRVILPTDLEIEEIDSTDLVKAELGELEECSIEVSVGECPICMANMNMKLLRTRCHHFFCESCLQIISNGSAPFCPICRRELSESSVPLNHMHMHMPVTADTWNLDIARAEVQQARVHFSCPDEKGTRRVVLDDDEECNIFVNPGVKIHVSPDVNFVINGRRVENPQDCSQS